MNVPGFINKFSGIKEPKKLPDHLTFFSPSRTVIARALCRILFDFICEACLKTSRKFSSFGKTEMLLVLASEVIYLRQSRIIGKIYVVEALSSVQAQTGVNEGFSCGENPLSDVQDNIRLLRPHSPHVEDFFILTNAPRNPCEGEISCGMFPFLKLSMPSKDLFFYNHGDFLLRKCKLQPTTRSSSLSQKETLEPLGC